MTLKPEDIAPIAPAPNGGAQSVAELMQLKQELERALAEAKEGRRLVREERAELDARHDRAINEMRTANKQLLNDRVEALVAQRLDAKTQSLQTALDDAKAMIASQASRITELEMSKRKLREALERLKEGR